MSEDANIAPTTATDSAPAAPAAAPSAPSAPANSQPAPSSAPTSGNDRPSGPSVPGQPPGVRRPRSDKPAASLPPPKSETTTPPPAAPAPSLSLEEVQKALNIKSLEDLKRFQNREQLFGRQTNELGQLRQRLSTFEKQDAERKAAAEAQKLKPWTKAHPEHAKFQSLHNKVLENNRRVSELAEMAKGLPPEQAQAWMEAQTSRIRGELTPDETAQWNAFVDYRKAEDMRWHTDREGVLTEHFDRMFSERLQRYEEEQRAKAEVQQDLEDPALKQFLGDEENKAQFDQALAGMQQDPWAFATHLVKMSQQNKQLWDELEKQKSQNGHVSEQLQKTQIQANLEKKKSQAAITRDVQPAKGNAYELARKEAQEKSIDPVPTNPAFRALIQKHVAAAASKG